MSKLIIDTKNEAQLNEIKQILTEKSIAFQLEEDYQFEREMKARKELVDWAESLPKYDITEKEIQSIVEEVRTERYAKRNQDNH
ncbi:MAG: hypothetical protein ABIN97_16795 [Ginsengibacter sp.]